LIDRSILITGGGGAASEAINRLLGDRYQFHFADADPDAIPTSIPESNRHQIPMADDNGFAGAVTQVCNKQNIDVLVPAVDEELPKMPQVSSLSDELKIMAPDPVYVDVMLDKLKSMEFLAERGIPVPKTLPLNRADEIGFPCIAKPRWGRGSRGVFTLNKPEDVAAYTQLTGFDHENAVAQEKIQGDEYTVTMVADSHGILREIIPVYVDVKRGITIRARVVPNQDVIQGCRMIHDAAPVKATYNVQHMLTADGQVMPFEINPRISTTFSLVLASGIDPFAAFLDEDDITLPFKGNRLQRFWVNEFSEY